MITLPSHPSDLRRRPGPLRFAVGVAIAALAVACGGGGDTVRLGQEGQDGRAALDDIEDTAAGSAVADVAYVDFDGGDQSLADFRGTPLVVNFFAAWCVPCIAEMPDFQTVFEEVEGEVAFLGLSQDTSADAALELVEETGVTYEIGWDRELDAYVQLGGIGVMPMTVFIDADSRVVESWPGVLPAAALREKIETLTVN